MVLSPSRIFSVFTSNMLSSFGFSLLTKVKLPIFGLASSFGGLGQFSFDCSRYSVENFRVLFKSLKSSLQMN